MDITGFTQNEGESLYKTWERFKNFQRRCPHHGLSDWLVIQIFYNGLNYPIKINIDATPDGGLMKKSTENTQVLI